MECGCPLPLLHHQQRILFDVHQPEQFSNRFTAVNGLAKLVALDEWTRRGEAELLQETANLSQFGLGVRTEAKFFAFLIVHVAVFLQTRFILVTQIAVAPEELRQLARG